MNTFIKDLQRKELWPVKILMFLIYGGQATLYPFFTVHLKSLGVGIRQTAIIFAVQPIVALIVAPLVGMAADKIGNFKFIFSFFLVSSAIATNLLLLVPPVEPLSDEILQFKIGCSVSLDGRLFPVTTELNTISSNCALETNVRNATIELKLLSCTDANGKDNVSQDMCFYNQDREQESFSPVTPLTITILFRDEKNDTKLSADVEFKVIRHGNKSYESISCACSLEPPINRTCILQSEGHVPFCKEILEENSFGKTFWMYLGIRCVVTLAIGLVNGLFDAAAMTVIQKLKADVGFQRFWSTVSMCLFAPLSGYLVDNYGDFNSCFYLYGSLYVLAAIISLTLDLSMKIPSENALKNFLRLLSNPEVVLMLVHVAALGICWGFLENFLFLFLEKELNSTKLLMGLTVTVGSGTGLFMALVATWFTRKLGYVNVMVAAFAAYTLRYIGYSFATDPYICLVYEMMENFTVTLLTVGVTMYCTELAPLQMLTTMMTLWNGLHTISGRAFGSLLGGFLMDRVGARLTFRLFAYGSAAFGLFYFFLNICWLKHWKQKRKLSSEDGNEKYFNPDDKEEHPPLQALASSTMHCSFDSPALVSYQVIFPIHRQRRAVSHVPTLAHNSFRDVNARPRLFHSFSIERTVMESIGDCNVSESPLSKPSVEITKL